jgi:sterol desaturase/sphingolipid hydroxylase (fatty acid hydroxylase superfamily)
MIYVMHRGAHVIPIIKQIHHGHHRHISKNLPPKWHWSNLFIYQDNMISTVDVWITEMIPTIIFCYITNQWYILLFYYIWSAFIQESIEHNPKFDIYPYLMSGRVHLIHHKESKYNYGLFIPIWDKLFGTFKYE